MPQRKINKSRKLVGGHKGTMKKKSTTTKSQKILNVTSKKPEIKTLDIPEAEYTINTYNDANHFALLNPIQQGAGFWNRIGKKITLKSLRMIGQLFWHIVGTVNNSSQYIRLMIVYDRQNSQSGANTNAFPTLSEVISDYSQTGAQTHTALSLLNMTNSERFRVFADIKYSIPLDNNQPVQNNPMGTYDSKGEYNIDRFINLENLETIFKSQTDPITIANINTGALYLIIFNNQDECPYRFRLKFRLRYEDN